MKKPGTVLAASPLFSNISAEALPELLENMNGVEKTFQKGEIIYSEGLSHRLSGVMLEGTAELHFCDEDFNLVSLIHLSEGDLFGAAMELSGKKNSPMELCALSDCRVLFLDFTTLLSEDTDSPVVSQFTKNLLQEFARRMQFLNMRVRILSQRRLRDKIKVYLQQLPQAPDGTIRLPMNRSKLADFLYVDRSALSRELSRMQEDGILQLDGKTVRLLDKTFLLP